MLSRATFSVCPTCKGEIKGIAYVCPECATMYCIRCAIKKSEIDESCTTCDSKLRFR